MRIFRAIKWFLGILLLCYGLVFVIFGVVILEPEERIRLKYKMIDFLDEEKKQ